MYSHWALELSSQGAIMRDKFLSAALGIAAIFCAAFSPAHAEAPDAADAALQARLGTQWTFFNDYCVKCHNFTDWAGEVAFDVLSPADVSGDVDVFETVVRKLQGRLMPPPGNKQPDQKAIDSFVSSLEGYLDHVAAGKGPQPGSVVLHRLNRTEYANEIQRILGLTVDPAQLLPPDSRSGGFSNVANVLHVSPSFLDDYIAAARQISLMAVGNAAAKPNFDVFAAPEHMNHTIHVEGLPLGTRGGMAVDYQFPADGNYEISIDVFSIGGSLLRSYPTGWLEYHHKLVLTIDGVQVFEGEIGGDKDIAAVDQHQTEAVTEILGRFLNIPVTVRAGRHKVGAAFVARSFAESAAFMQPLTPGEGEDAIPIVRGLQILGPRNVTGVSETVSRERIFICRPESQQDETPCAERILSTLANKAFRSTATEKEIRTLMDFYEAGAEDGGFESGIQKGVMALLASPHFLYRLEPAPADVTAGSAYDVGPLELASRLSFFLWSQGPDKELLSLAESGQLNDPDVLTRQVKRMLADPKARSLVTNFAFQWLDIDGADAVDPDKRVYPNFDDDLRSAFRQEIELFIGSVFAEDHSVLDLLTADYTFVNGRLARNYGIPGVRGEQFRRVTLADSHRWGLFGKGSVLLVTSYPNRTSPVLRGQWILDKILGAPPSAPPPNVDTDLDNEKLGGATVSVRERLEIHRSDPSCNTCHGVIDPLGLALENFDSIGEWRDIDRFARSEIDASGSLANGTPVNGPDDLRAALMNEPEQFVQTMTERLLTYALGRVLTAQDMPVVRSIVRGAAAQDYRFSSIVLGIVHSDPFRMRAVTAEASAAPVKEASLGHDDNPLSASAH
jgi:hypothetical protein